jgi:nicotinamidase-related amidase
MATDFKPALIVVDVQEDFCPPVSLTPLLPNYQHSTTNPSPLHQSGSLAVPNGRAIIPTVNHLLALPFALKICTKDWHPANHISFASNHPGSPPPFTSFATVRNPANADERYDTRLWPVHCVQGTPGAEIVPEVDMGRVDRVVEKGLDARVEMYSAFYDPLKNPRCSDSGLAGVLKGEGVTDVYVVGLAADYCVRFTAVDAAAEGFGTYIVKEGTRAVDEGSWAQVREEIEEKGVKVVGMDGEEVGRVMALGKTGCGVGCLHFSADIQS